MNTEKGHTVSMLISYPMLPDVRDQKCMNF